MPLLSSTTLICWAGSSSCGKTARSVARVSSSLSWQALTWERVETGVVIAVNTFAAREPAIKTVLSRRQGRRGPRPRGTLPWRRAPWR